MKKFIPLLLILPLLLTPTTGCGKKPTTTTQTGKGNAKLTLAVPQENIKLAQGKRQEFSVTAKRENFDGAIALSFGNLPTGVTIVEATKEIPKGKDQAVFTLEAKGDAELKDDPVAVAITGTNDEAGVNPTVYLQLKVEESLENQGKRRSELVANMNKKLTKAKEKWKMAIGGLKQASVGFMEEFAPTIKAVSRDLKNTQDRLDNLEKAPVEKWEAHKEAVTGAVQNVETAVDNAVRRLETHLKEQGKKDEKE